MKSLSRSTLPELAGNPALQLPSEEMFSLPEKILQFGTGVLLRGLPDFFVEQANRAGKFNGRIVVVKSTDGGDADAFTRQNNLYTLCIKGVKEGNIVEENLVCSAISRVLIAKTQWNEILACAVSPDLQAVVSNTTEVGIQLVEESIDQAPPQSFPAKLLAILRARYDAFAGAADKGLVIVPTELIPDNGTKLKNILLELAQFNGLSPEFVRWMETANTFCNSLVDRIVPGHPGQEAAARLEQELGYKDDLLAVSEVYRLWAIEGGEKVKKVLSFWEVDPGVIIEPDISVYRELKLRLLNATHTLSCGFAHLCGFDTVKEAMADPEMNAFIRHLMLEEIAPAIPHPVDLEKARAFGREVVDRFANPFLDHHWLSITLQYSSKMLMRVMPVLIRYYENFGKAPEAISLGFAAWLRFIQPAEVVEGIYYGAYNGVRYRINDDKAEHIYKRLQGVPPNKIPESLLSDQMIWKEDLTGLPGFVEKVAMYHAALTEGNAKQQLSNFSH